VAATLTVGTGTRAPADQCSGEDEMEEPALSEARGSQKAHVKDWLVIRLLCCPVVIEEACGGRRVVNVTLSEELWEASKDNKVIRFRQYARLYMTSP
jgi:hypothetical protein